MNCRDGCLNLLFCSEKTRAQTHDALFARPQGIVHERRAVCARPRCYAPAVHEGVRDLGGAEIPYVKRDDTRAPNTLAPVPVDAHAGKRADALVETPCEGELTGTDPLDPALVPDEVNAGGKARNAVPVERAGLEPRGPLLGLEGVEAVLPP